MKGRGTGGKESDAYNPTYKCGCNNNYRVEGYGAIHYDGAYMQCVRRRRKRWSVKGQRARERHYAQNNANSLIGCNADRRKGNSDTNKNGVEEVPADNSK